jgi:hypothetical protein
MRSRNTRGRGWLPNAGLVFCALVVAVIACELVLRISGLAPGPRAETWDDRTRIVRTEESRYFERLNSLGLRGGSEFDQGSKAHQLVFLGDSFVWGLGVSDDELMSHWTEERLEASSGAAWSVLAAGRPGMGTVAEHQLLLELVPRLRIDGVVLFYFVDNDPWDNLWESALVSGSDPGDQVRRARGESGTTRTRAWLYRRSAFYRFLRARFFAVGTVWEVPKRILEQCRRDHGGSFRASDALTRNALEGIRKTVAAAGGQFIGVVIIPRQEQITAQGFEHFVQRYQLDPRNYDRGLPQQRLIRDVLLPGGFNYLDLSAGFEGRDASELYFRLDGHFTPVGHREVAERVSSWILEHWKPPSHD